MSHVTPIPKPSPGSFRPIYIKPSQRIEQSIEASEVSIDLGRMYPEIRDTVISLGRKWSEDVRLWTQSQTDFDETIALLKSPSGFSLSKAWTEHLSSTERKLASISKLLIMEKLFSRNIAKLSSGVLGSMKLPRTIQVVREHVGFRLMDVADESGWQRPVTCARGYRLAREYFRAVIEGVGTRNAASDYHVHLNLARSTIKLSRYERVSSADLKEALEAIQQAQQYNDSKIDLVNLELEALIRIFDIDGDADKLYRGVLLIESRNVQLTSEAMLGLAESWLRISHVAHIENTFDKALRKSKSYINSVSDYSDWGHVGRARYQLIMACIDTTSFPVSWSVQGMQLPFGITLKDHRHSVVSSEIAQSLAGSLNASPVGEPLERKIASGLLSMAARQERDRGRRIGLLESSIELRLGNRDFHVDPWPRAALQDEQSRVETARDILALSETTKNIGRRFIGLRLLVSIIQSGTQQTLPLIILCDEIEKNGPLKIQNNSYSKSIPKYLRKGIENKNLSPIYNEAASRAYSSHDLEHRYLGGRGDVVAIEDPMGIVDKTFVFKRTTNLNLSREEAQHGVIARGLKDLGMAEALILPESLASLQLPAGVTSRNSQHEVVSVRRFADAQTVHDYLSVRPLEVPGTLKRISGLLGCFHSVAQAFPTKINDRKALKSKEFGYWLKNLSGQSASEYFDLWWQIIGKSPSLPKRDAHLLNWMIDANSNVIALDMEAAGSRPLGYELAQITEDSMLISPQDFRLRRSIFDEYFKSLYRDGISPDKAIAWESYIAGIIARCTFLLSQPEAADGSSLYALETLEECMRQSHVSFEISAFIVDAWKQSRGFKSSDSPETITAKARRKLSKQLAYTLRHNRDILFAAGGWVALEEVVLTLRKSGVITSPSKLLSVALAHDEERFEVADSLPGGEIGQQLIRAKYGHSRPVDIVLPVVPGKIPNVLFHATATESMEKIIGSSEGLRPMARQWVHMSTDPQKAFRTGKRHGSVILFKVNPNAVDGLVRASDSVWLAQSVPVNALELVTVVETSSYFGK